MGERSGPDNQENDGISRRQFIKGVVAMGVAGAFAGSETQKLSHEGSEKGMEEQAARMVIMGELREKKIPTGTGIDIFYPESGWGDEYRIEAFEKAVQLANKGVDVYHLQENDVIKVPYKVEKE
ncbi:MAG: twin-arginine translocation signal domain-containing protein [bacterium]